jgi:trigger factor
VDARLLEALRTSGRRAVATRSVEPGSLERGKPFKVTAKVEVLPAIEEVVTEGLVAERPTTQVDDTDVEGELARLRETQAELVPIDPPRPARKGDVVLVDYEATLEGSSEPASKADGRRIELGEPGLLPGFEDAIVGANEGDRREATITFPDDHAREDLREKVATFVIQVREVRAKLLPDLDDEFARDLGEHESLDALRASIRERFEKVRASSSEQALRRSVRDDLARKNPLPIPTVLVEAQASSMEQELLAMVAPQDPKMRLSDEIRTQLRGQAERRVRSELLVGELARRDGIEASDEEIEAHLAGLAASSGKSLAKVRAEHSEGNRRERLRSELVESKIVDKLLEGAEIRDAKPADRGASP